MKHIQIFISNFMLISLFLISAAPLSFAQIKYVPGYQINGIFSDKTASTENVKKKTQGLWYFSKDGKLVGIKDIKKNKKQTQSTWFVKDDKLCTLGKTKAKEKPKPYCTRLVFDGVRGYYRLNDLNIREVHIKQLTKGKQLK